MANEIVRYCQSGHAFHVVGDMSVGGTIVVTVEPLEGYQFVKWSDGNTDNPRTIEITECGVTYTGIFAEGSGDEFFEIFDSLSILVDGEGYDYGYTPSGIEEEDIISSLGEIIG